MPQTPPEDPAQANKLPPGMMTTEQLQNVENSLKTSPNPLVAKLIMHIRATHGLLAAAIEQRDHWKREAIEQRDHWKREAIEQRDHWKREAIEHVGLGRGDQPMIVWPTWDDVIKELKRELPNYPPGEMWPASRAYKITVELCKAAVAKDAEDE